MVMRSIFLLIVGFFAVGPASFVSADDFDIEKLQTRIFDTIKKVKPSVVSISGGGSVFSGVIVSDQGHVLSAGHAVTPGRTYSVTLSDGRRLLAKGMGSNTRQDCALVKITRGGNLPHAELGDSSQVTANQPCLSLSFPGGQGRRAPVVRFGHIALSRSGSGMIQSTALMEPGDSGGPLFDLNGKVIGIHSRIGKSMNRNYEVPINTYKKYWEQLNEARKFTSSSGPSLPSLGFRGGDRDEKDGVFVHRVDAQGLAKQSGIQVNDVITEVDGGKVTSLSRLRIEMTKSLRRGAKQIEIKLRRGAEEKIVKMPFVKKTSKILKLSMLPQTKTPKEQPMAELSRLPSYFAKLESQLDDNCVTVTSKFAGKSTKINATLLAGTNLLISKNSMIGQSPVASVQGQQVKLDVIARSTVNDLVLLKRQGVNKAGVKFMLRKKASVGQFLVTPDPDGAGLVSVCSTQEFNSPKRQSKGYLGVVLATHESRGVILDEVRRGAAKDAGLKVGDVIVQMNSTKIKSRGEMLRFLAQTDPRNTVKAIVERGEDKLEKDITLGALPAQTNHAADMMEKSGRRDGFQKVLSHDADLSPKECGGPIFDLKGDFIGINIARNSRVRSFVIPEKVVQAFVEANKK